MGKETEASFSSLPGCLKHYGQDFYTTVVSQAVFILNVFWKRGNSHAAWFSTASLPVSLNEAHPMDPSIEAELPAATSLYEWQIWCHTSVWMGLSDVIAVLIGHFIICQLRLQGKSSNPFTMLHYNRTSHSMMCTLTWTPSGRFGREGWMDGWIDTFIQSIHTLYHSIDF